LPGEQATFSPRAMLSAIISSVSVSAIGTIG
jgi:hypothetical protein